MKPDVKVSDTFSVLLGCFGGFSGFEPEKGAFLLGFGAVLRGIPRMGRKVFRQAVVFARRVVCCLSFRQLSALTWVRFGMLRI